MIKEKQETFTAFMEEFVKLNIEQKNSEIIEKQKVILAFLLKYALEHGIEFEFMKSKEITDIDDNSGTYEDYLEAMMVYTQNIEELIGLILKSNESL
ncbi:MAG: hypothetical protein E7170_03720 [Firmicutes bacterium]|nr:hypothetical protein [Bacillota bacterium]